MYGVVYYFVKTEYDKGHGRQQLYALRSTGVGIEIILQTNMCHKE